MYDNYFSHDDVVVDIDDCASFPCGFDNECFDMVNGYTCSCATGYVPDNTSTQCTGSTQIFHRNKLLRHPYGVSR